MKKFLLMFLFFSFVCPLSAQEYTFPLDQINELEININKGQLYVRSAVDDNKLSINIFPEKPETLKQKIKLKDRKIEINLDDTLIDQNTVITIKAPLKADIEIESIEADINVSNMSGSLSIEAAAGNVKIDNFKGKLDLDIVQTEVSARGTFDELEIETDKGNVSIKIDELPYQYKYKVKGSGNVFIDPGTKIKRGRKLDVEKDKEFRGKLDIKHR